MTGDRRKTRRFREFLRLGRSANVDKVRADRATADVVRLQEALAEQEARHEAELADLRDTMARVVAERGELEGQLRRRDSDTTLRDLVEERDNALDMVRTMRERAETTAVLLAHQEARLVELRADDRDAAKLRRRLRERDAELASAHARIRQLEAGARDAAASAPVVFAAVPAAPRHEVPIAESHCLVHGMPRPCDGCIVSLRLGSG